MSTRWNLIYFCPDNVSLKHCTFGYYDWLSHRFKYNLGQIISLNKNKWMSDAIGLRYRTPPSLTHWKSLSHVRPYGLYSPWNSPGQNTGVGSCSLLQGIFPTQGLNLSLLPCRWSPALQVNSLPFETEELGGLQSMGSQRVSHNWMIELACMQAIFHCVYVPHLLYPFICRWISRLLSCPSALQTLGYICLFQLCFSQGICQ